MLKAIQLGQQLTKKEMKEIKGGGTCCAHVSEAPGNEIWSCNLTKDAAISTAGQMAYQYGTNAYWCCASCPQQ